MRDFSLLELLLGMELMEENRASCETDSFGVDDPDDDIDIDDFELIDECFDEDNDDV